MALEKVENSDYQDIINQQIINLKIFLNRSVVLMVYFKKY